MLWCSPLLGWLGVGCLFFLRCILGAEGSVSAPLPDSSALDSVHEALRLLDSVPRSAENREQLLDDRAQALLWLYICTLESKLEEVCGGTHGCPNASPCFAGGVCSAPSPGSLLPVTCCRA